MNERELYALAEEVLTDTQWRRVWLHLWQGIPVATIAEAERVSPQAVRGSIDGGLRVLRAARDARETEAA